MRAGDVGDIFAPGTRRDEEQEETAAAAAAASADGGEEADGERVGSIGGRPNRMAARPQTARRRPPRVKPAETGAGGPTARGAAGAAGGTPSGAPAGVMSEGADADSEDEEDAAGGLGLVKGGAGGGGAGRGRHTRDILGRAREESGRAGPGRSESKTDEAASGPGAVVMGRIGAVGARGVGGAKMDMEGLRTAVQALVQAATPLGQSMGYAREDMDDMRAELAQWAEETRSQAEALAAARQETADALRPFESQLRSAEDACLALEARIAQAEAKMASNDGRMRELTLLAVTRGGGS